MKLIGQLSITLFLFMVETMMTVVSVQGVRDSWWMLLVVSPIWLFVTFICVGLSYDVWIGLD